MCQKKKSQASSGEAAQLKLYVVYDIDIIIKEVRLTLVCQDLHPDFFLACLRHWLILTVLLK